MSTMGLVGACREAEPAEQAGDVGPRVARVVTVGSIDPLVIDWGVEPTRFGGATWTHPVVDREQLPPKVGRWLDRLSRPKVLLATQAKVLEPVIDRTGDVAPATPLIAVLASEDDLDRVAAVLLAPPVTLWAWRRWFGAALSVDALKLSARQVAELPLPSGGRGAEAWDEASRLVAAGGRRRPRGRLGSGPPGGRADDPGLRGRARGAGLVGRAPQAPPPGLTA